MRFRRLSLLFGFLLGCSTSDVRAAGPITFDDVSASSGLDGLLEGNAAQRPWRYAHGAAWGDVDGDDRPDLFLGAFAARPWFEGPQRPEPNMLLLNREEGFRRASDDAAFAARSGKARCAGALFADWDNDGDVDLCVTNHVQKPPQEGSKLYENLGAGRFRDVTPAAIPWNEPLGMRNVAALDLDDDGLLDLLLCDGSYGRQAEAAARLRVLKNRGSFQFDEVGEQFGFPTAQTPGLGLALGDVNNDGRPDVFVCGANRLFVTTPRGVFREVRNPALQYAPLDVSEGLRCGAALADLDGDDRLDLIVTEHGVPTRLRLFHNRGIENGVPELVDVSEPAGLGAPFPRGTREHPLKTAHVALRDVDNDGRIDVLLTVVARDASGRLQPVVLRNLTERGGPLKFSSPPSEAMVGYYAPGPVADFDRDGRIDLMLPSWFEDMPNRLFRNTTDGGRPLTVRVRGDGKRLNRQGIGAVVRAYAAGHVGEPLHLLARSDVVIGTGYASGEEALAHLGLGSAEAVDVRVTWGPLLRDVRGVKTGQLLNVDFSP